MRIVYVTERLPFGTGESFIVPEVEALLAAGHELRIVPRISTDPVVHDDVDALLARVRPVPGAPRAAAALAVSMARRPVRTAASLGRLRHTRPRRRIAANLLATAEGAWLARMASAWRADHIHAHWAHLTATMAMAASALSGIPWSFTAHRYDVLLNNLLEQKLRSARFGRFIAREMLEAARGMVGPATLARAVVIHMGVPLPPPGRPPRARPAPVALCPARMTPVKGHRYLLEAAARLAARGVRCEFWLAGEGPNAGAIARQIREAGLGERVRLLGTVPHRELLGIYRDGLVDCVVLPSLHEGLSVALVEAMAHGVPVVATGVGGVPELLGRGAGVLVPPREPAALAHALGRVLGSAELRAALARAGRRRVAEEFEVTAIAERLAEGFAGRLRREALPSAAEVALV